MKCRTDVTIRFAGLNCVARRSRSVVGSAESCNTLSTRVGYTRHGKLRSNTTHSALTRSWGCWYRAGLRNSFDWTRVDQKTIRTDDNFAMACVFLGIYHEDDC